MFTIRRLERRDIDQGLLGVLAHLSQARPIPQDTFDRIMLAYYNKKGPYVVMVAEEEGRIIGTATLIMAWKLLRGGVRAGRITDVTTHPDHQGRGIGSTLVRELLVIAGKSHCYKVTLNCAEKNVGWYKRFGFRRHEVAMRLDLDK